MDLGLSEEQTMLKDSAVEFLNAELPKTRVRELFESEDGFAPDIWQHKVEMDEKRQQCADSALWGEVEDERIHRELMEEQAQIYRLLVFCMRNLGQLWLRALTCHLLY